MGNDFNSRALVISQKVYGWLLRVYPKAHRQAYGPAMAQLFRDQCRDAWEEEQDWGMVKLWLRVLPDLVSTSIAERLAALHERKSMTDKLANMSRFRGATPFATFASIFVAVFLVVFPVSVVITFLLPKTYASTARIVDEDPLENHVTRGDPAYLKTTFAMIQSPEVLNPVIETLNLNVQWGKRYNKGRALDPSNTFKILKQRISLIEIRKRPYRDEQYFDITVYSEGNKEAAEIANEIARSYMYYRFDLVTEANTRAIKTLDTELHQQEAQIRQAQSEVDLLRANISNTNGATASLWRLEQTLWDKQYDLDRLTKQHIVLGAARKGCVAK
jgi:capsular polysaccharide biosynthesis protein